MALTVGQQEEGHRHEDKLERIPTTTQATVPHILLAGGDLVVSPRKSIVWSGTKY